MGYIHSCSLRWALQEEGKLDFHSNLRLFTSSAKSKPNGNLANKTFLAGIVLSYYSIPLIFVTFDPLLAQVLNSQVAPVLETDRVYINSMALLALGLGLIIQAIIAFWSLGCEIRSWSANPLDTARVCAQPENEKMKHQIQHREGRALMSVHDQDLDPESRYPLTRQDMMCRAHKHVRRVVWFAGFMLAGSYIWAFAVYVSIRTGNKNGVLGNSSAPWRVITGSVYDCGGSQCTNGTSILHIDSTGQGSSLQTEAWGFLIVLFQVPFSVSLHCAELVVNLTQDEYVYRQLIDPRGTSPYYDAISSYFNSWPKGILFALKVVVHFLFGQSVNLSYELGVNMYWPPLVWLAAANTVTFLFILHLATRRPRGPLPAAYGHLQTIVDVIDEWPETKCMFWGHKSPKLSDDDTRAPCYAGTSGGFLHKVRQDMKYGGGAQDVPTPNSLDAGSQSAADLG